MYPTLSPRFSMPLKMRRLLLHALLSVSCIALFSNTNFAQGLKQPVYIYLTAGGGAGTVNHGFVELHTLFLKRHGISLGYNTYQRKATSTPSDYEPGGFELFGPGLPPPPQDFLDGFTITYSYVLYPKHASRTNMLRYPLSIGALLGTYSEPGNFHRTSSWFGANYNYDDIAGPGFAVIMRGGLEYTPTRAFGLRAGAFAVLGNMSGVGVYGGLMLGHVGSRKRLRHRGKSLMRSGVIHFHQRYRFMKNERTFFLTIRSTP